MTRFGFLSLALLSLQAFVGTGFAADAEKVAETEAVSLAVSAEASFPASEIFGVKLVNGHPTQALISFTNDEPNPVTVNFLGGSLWSLDEQSKNVRNLTATRYGVEIPANSKESISYSFSTEMHPVDVRLNIAAIMSDDEGRFFTVQAFNGTVSVVEPETSIFDPQIIFLYFFLLACFVGVVYFFYTVWVAPYFPQKRKGGKTGEKKTPAKREILEETPSPAVASATTYNADWIPAHHINRPEARKVKGSKSKARA
ncbi:increased recombination centers protein 22 [Penicillium ochrochloron]